MSKKEVYYSKFDGKKINRLTILSLVPSDTRNTIVEASCECGTIKRYTLSNIVSGHATSCGCFHKETAKMMNFKHGLSSHPLHHVWTDMIYRCTNKNSVEYSNYGGRGVVVCEEWRLSFKSFYDWAINKWKSGLQLDKDILSPNKVGDLYSPEFCLFVSTSQNSRKKKKTRVIEYNGESMCLMDWAKRYNKDYGTLHNRLKRGMTIGDAITLPNIVSNQYLKKLAS